MTYSKADVEEIAQEKGIDASWNQTENDWLINGGEFCTGNHTKAYLFIANYNRR